MNVMSPTANREDPIRDSKTMSRYLVSRSNVLLVQFGANNCGLASILTTWVSMNRVAIIKINSAMVKLDVAAAVAEALSS